MKKERALEIPSLLLVYGGLVLFSILGDFFTHKNCFWVWQQSHLTNSVSILFAGSFTVLYVLVASLSTRLFRWIEQLERFFAQVLTPLSYFQVIYLALLSGFIEEWFFRGILLTHFGLILSSILFGLAHLLPDRILWRWSILSFMAGIALGGLYQFSHSLVLVATVHTTINGVLLFRLNQARMGSPSLT